MGERLLWDRLMDLLASTIESIFEVIWLSGSLRQEERLLMNTIVWYS